MRKAKEKTVFELTGDYFNAVGKYGPDSIQAAQLRETNKNNAEFLRIADGCDRLKRKLGGSGIDYPPE